MIAGEIGGSLERIARISVNAEEHHRVQEGVFALLDRLGGLGAFFATDVSRTGRPHTYGLIIGELRAPTEAEVRAAWPMDIRMVVKVETLRGESIEAKKRSLVRVISYALKSWPTNYGTRGFEDVVVRGMFVGPWTRTVLPLSERSGATQTDEEGADGGVLPGGGNSRLLGASKALHIHVRTATETSAESDARVCVWCGRPIAAGRRKDARTCLRSACRVGFDRALARLQEPQDDEWPPPPDPLAGVRRRVPIAPLTDEEQLWFDIYVEREAICVEAGVALPIAQEIARREADAVVAEFRVAGAPSEGRGSAAPSASDLPGRREGEEGDGTENR